VQVSVPREVVTQLSFDKFGTVRFTVVNIEVVVTISLGVVAVVVVVDDVVSPVPVVIINSG